MGNFHLNLSTRPFPAYRLTNVLLSIVLVLLVVVSAWQAYGFLSYSALAKEIQDQERSARIEAEALAQRQMELEKELNTPEAAAKLSEIGFLNDLIARKTFSWTRVLAHLEEIAPDMVHLTALTPEITDGGIRMRIAARGRNIDSISEFISGLEASDVFENVVVSTEEKLNASASGDVDVTLAVNYFPEKEDQ